MMHEELTKAFLFILINHNTYFDSPVFLFLSPTFAIFESSCHRSHKTAKVPSYLFYTILQCAIKKNRLYLCFVRKKIQESSTSMKYNDEGGITSFVKVK